MKADSYYKSREPPSKKTEVEATCSRSKACSSPKRLATVPVTGVERYRKPKRCEFGVETHFDEGRLGSNKPAITLASPIPFVETGERYGVERAAAGVVKGLLAIVSFPMSKGHMNDPKEESPSNFEVEEYGEDRCRPKRRDNDLQEWAEITSKTHPTETTLSLSRGRMSVQRPTCASRGTSGGRWPIICRLGRRKRQLLGPEAIAN